MSDALKDVRVQLLISRPELERLDAWRGAQPIWSRSEAIRLLITRALDSEDTAASAPRKRGKSSK